MGTTDEGTFFLREVATGGFRAVFIFSFILKMDTKTCHTVVEVSLTHERNNPALHPAGFSL